MKPIKSHTLLEVSKATGIQINSLRYHLRKLKPLFEHLKRDRYNRFRFMSHDIQRLQQIHEMKSQGYDYESIRSRLGGEASATLSNSLPGPPNTSNRLSEIERALKENGESVQRMEAKMESLEQRLELLVDMHTKQVLGTS